MLSPRRRVNHALQHKSPDRTPVDFLAVPEIWKKLVEAKGLKYSKPVSDKFFDQVWEKILLDLEVDCRVISYDQFYAPPQSVLFPGAKVDWFSSPSRSTPNRMWRQISSDNAIMDIWGRQFKIVQNPFGAYEEIASYPLAEIDSISDISKYPWPDPDWWDFSLLPEYFSELDTETESHLRYRAGSIFEVGWQLRGMEKFFLDLSLEPKIPIEIMERLTEITIETTRRFLIAAGDRVDMVYFYDDVATQNSLMMSRQMWHKFIRPHHAKIIEVAKSFGKQVMYHCDGAIYPLIPDLIDLGIDVLNPVQADAKGMLPDKLKKEFGDRLSFHGGIDIIKTLPNGTPQEVGKEVKTRISQLGGGGGYILASSHHIQADTPLENIYAMYDFDMR